LLYNSPRAATIIAKTDCILWNLDRETFNNIVKEAAVKKRELYENFLNSVDIFSTMNPYEISQVCDAILLKKFKKGDAVIKQNEPGDNFYIVEEGYLQATKLFEGKMEDEVVMKYEKGKYFGELALIKNEPRAATITAISDCRLLTLDRLAFKRLLGPIETLLKRNSSQYVKYIHN
jgi:cAMP-dependent protein kinase regulator